MKKLLTLCLCLWVSNFSTAQADSFEAIYNQAQWLPVVVLDSTDESPKLGVLAANVTLKYKKGLSGSWTTQTLNDDCATPSAGDWCEEEDGVYRVYLAATVYDTKGKFYYKASGSGYKTYYGVSNVETLSSEAESDLFSANQLSVDASGQVILQDGSLTSSKFEKTSGFAFCDVTASTSATSFQIGACTDWQSNSLTLASDMFELWGLVAYTNGGSNCNVAAQGIMVQDSIINASNLDITVATDSGGRGAYSATPSDTNCGVLIVK